MNERQPDTGDSLSTKTDEDIEKNIADLQKEFDFLERILRALQTTLPDDFPSNTNDGVQITADMIKIAQKIAALIALKCQRAPDAHDPHMTVPTHEPYHAQDPFGNMPLQERERDALKAREKGYAADKRAFLAKQKQAREEREKRLGTKVRRALQRWGLI